MKTFLIPVFLLALTLAQSTVFSALPVPASEISTKLVSPTDVQWALVNMEKMAVLPAVGQGQKKCGGIDIWQFTAAMDTYNDALLRTFADVNTLLYSVPPIFRIARVKHQGKTYLIGFASYKDKPTMIRCLLE